jgi:hypothetical protein
VRNVARFLVAFFANAPILLEGDFEALDERVFEGALENSLEGADTTRQDNRRTLPIALGDCVVCFVSVGRISPAAPHHHFKISSLSLDRASLTRPLFKPHHKTTFRHTSDTLQTHTFRHFLPLNFQLLVAVIFHPTTPQKPPCQLLA